MKTSKIISGALAAVMVASTMAVGGVAASAATVKKPTKVKAVNTTKGIKISWKKVKGAKKYKVYRGKKVLKTVKKAKYTDKKAKAGKKYKYAVKAVKGSAVSKASKKVSVTRLKKPTLSSVKATAEGIKATWKKVKGATKYIVYRKSTGKYAKLATVKAKTYTDKKVTSGTAYSYKVKAVKGTSKSVASAAKSATFLAMPTGMKFTADKAASKVTLSWNAVKGAASYTVYSLDINTGKTTKLQDVKTPSVVIAPETKNIDVLYYSIVAKNGSVSSAATGTAFLFVPADSYYTDPADKTVHAKVTLKVGEKYNAAAGVTADGVEVKQLNGEDVASLDKDYTVTAKKAGTTQIQVKFTSEVGKNLLKALAEYGYSFSNDLSAGIAYLDVTVVE